jgi:amidase
MRLDDYAACDAVTLADLIRRGEVSAAEVESAARAAIARVNPELNALAYPLLESALDHAADGVLGGVPFAIKDTGPYAEGMPFCLGSRFLEGSVAPVDAYMMQRFRAAGLATIGITAAPELTISFSTESVRGGPTCNPWNPAVGVGGSSGGAAALVAAGALPLAHANDGAGSVRIPASCCGLVGLKPSRGRTPVGPYMWDPIYGLAYEFVVTRSIRDAAAVLDAVAGDAPGEKYFAPAPQQAWARAIEVAPRPLRIGFTTQAWSGVPIDDEVVKATEAAAAMLAAAGHHVEPASPLIDPVAILQAYVPFTVSALAGVFATGTAPRTAENLEAVSLRLFDEAGQLNGFDMARAFQAANQVVRAIGAFFETYDVLITPTLARLPAPHGHLRYNDPAHTVESWLASIFDYGPFTAPFNISGQPAISLPLGQSQSGLPIGVHLVGQSGREDVLLQLGRHFEQEIGWHKRRPAIFVAS